MENTYILDTSVMAHNPNALDDFKQSNIIIPIYVLEELDKLKTNYNIAGANARQFLKILDSLTQENNSNSVALESGSTLILDSKEYSAIGSDKSYGDNKILGCALNYSKQQPTILVSRDSNLRIRARALGIKSENYSKDLVISDDAELYTGTKTIEVEAEEIRSLYDNDILCVDSDWVKKNKVHPNQFILLMAEDGSNSAACRFHADMTLRLLSGKTKAFGLASKNREQTYALDLLFDDNIKLVTLSGSAGCGKTILCTAAALEQVVNEKKYEKFFITKSIETVGKDIGALPGTKLEKMAPFVQSIMDNVASLFSKSKKKATVKKPSPMKKSQDEVMLQDPYLALLLENGHIEVESIAFMRGRSIDNAFILIDECQNLSQEIIKTIITRAGHNTKIVCTGDLDQIDLPNLNAYNNGLTYLVERFKDQAIAGHITLTKGERSELATLASKLL